VTEIPEAHFDLVCCKKPRCKFIGVVKNKNLCLKGSPYLPAIIQLEITYKKEAESEDNDVPTGDNCPGMHNVNLIDDGGIKGI